ncbi:MAG: trans-sulfuration enzyme family protein [Terriglobales bacterium]
MHPATRAVHAGGAAEAGARPVSVPIHPSSTFYYSSAAELDAVAGGAPGYMYARYRNPTGVALEAAVAALDDAPAALSFASGMAALHAAVLACGFQPGDVLVCHQEVYGGTVSLLLNVLAPLGLDIRFTDCARPEALDQALAGGHVRMLLVESLSNPLLNVLDLRQMAEKAHAAGARLLVDATFTPPPMVHPLALGADYAVHSATKYLGGHGDVTGGVVLAAEADLPALDAVRKLVGGTLGAFEAWLVLRGLKTLPLRFERQCANARAVASFLRSHGAIARVFYPGFDDHPQHALAARQFGGVFGAMVSCEVRGAERAHMFALLDRLRVILPCTSLGDVQSLVMYPAIASHRDLAPKQRQRLGIGDNLLRFSCGIEDPRDLTADLEQALAASVGVPAPA